MALQNRVILVSFKGVVQEVFGPMTFEECIECAAQHRDKSPRDVQPFLSYEYATLRKW